MVRTQLSSNFLAERIVIVIAVIITLPLLLIIKDLPDYSPLVFIVCVIVYGFCGLSIYMGYYVVSNIAYDDLALYIKFKKQEKSIPLKDVVEIKMTARWGSWRRQWRIMYIENNHEQKAYFYAKYGLISLRRFVKAVKSQNPKVDYVYVVLSNDFD
jgi:hypothetical protein